MFKTIWLFLSMSILIVGKRQITSGRPAGIFKNVYNVSKIDCFNLDTKFVRLDQCELKTVNSSHYFNIHVVLLQPPVTKSTVNLALFRRNKEYRPFVLNLTLDVCEFFSGRKNYFLDWFYQKIIDYTNINHTCPYSSDMIVKDVPLRNMKQIVYLGNGDYRLDFTVSAYDVPRVMLMGYFRMF